jgi:flagellar hook-associated protein 2
MSSSGISFGGLASGLDTKAIISALTSLERRPIAALETKKSLLGKQKSLFGDLKNLIEKLATSVKALKTTSDFLQFKAASSDEDILTVSASSAATAGTHDVKVLDLATAQINHTTGQADRSTSYGGPASLQIDIGGNTYFVAVTNPTLDSIAAAINDQEIGVSANVVDTGNPDASKRYQLVLRADEAGNAGAFSLAYDDGDPAFAALVGDLVGNQDGGTDARVEIDGIEFFRPSNSISDAIPGVTLDLRSFDPAKTVKVTVSTDTEEISKKVQEFVGAYNAIVDFVSGQNVVDSEGKTSSPLFGDSLLRSVRSSLRSIAGGLVTDTGNESYQLLAQVGIKSDKDGKLTLDSTRFGEALAADEGAVTALFTNPTTGLANRFIEQLDLYTDSVDGLFKTRNESFDRQVKDTQRRIDDGERRLTLYTQQLETRYANLESLLGKLQSQGSSLNSLSNLSSN